MYLVEIVTLEFKHKLSMLFFPRENPCDKNVYKRNVMLGF